MLSLSVLWISLVRMLSTLVGMKNEKRCPSAQRPYTGRWWWIHPPSITLHIYTHAFILNQTPTANMVGVGPPTI